MNHPRNTVGHVANALMRNDDVTEIVPLATDIGVDPAVCVDFVPEFPSIGVI